ncbi:hypothetical protein VSK90_04080 [Bacillus swezeyi]
MKTTSWQITYHGKFYNHQETPSIWKTDETIADMRYLSESEN